MPENDEIGKAIRERKTNGHATAVVQNAQTSKRQVKPFVLSLKDDGGPYKLLSEIKAENPSPRERSPTKSSSPLKPRKINEI